MYPQPNTRRSRPLCESKYGSKSVGKCSNVAVILNGVAIPSMSIIFMWAMISLTARAVLSKFQTSTLYVIGATTLCRTSSRSQRGIRCALGKVVYGPHHILWGTYLFLFSFFLLFCCIIGKYITYFLLYVWYVCFTIIIGVSYLGEK